MTEVITIVSSRGQCATAPKKVSMVCVPVRVIPARGRMPKTVYQPSAVMGYETVYLHKANDYRIYVAFGRSDDEVHRRAYSVSSSVFCRTCAQTLRRRRNLVIVATRDGDPVDIPLHLPLFDDLEEYFPNLADLRNVYKTRQTVNADVVTIELQ